MDLNNMTNDLHEILCKPALDNSIEIMRHNVEMLALQRRTIELLGVKEHLDKYDAEFTKTVDEQYEKFAKMNMNDLMMYMKSRLETMK